jgi:hypothetical protein
MLDCRRPGLVEETLAISRSAQAWNTIFTTDLALKFVIVGELFICNERSAHKSRLP